MEKHNNNNNNKKCSGVNLHIRLYLHSWYITQFKADVMIVQTRNFTKNILQQKDAMEMQMCFGVKWGQENLLYLLCLFAAMLLLDGLSCLSVQNLYSITGH